MPFSGQFCPADSGPGALVRLITELRGRFGEHVSVDAVTRAAHSRGEGMSVGQHPDAVVFAKSTEDVAEIVRACAQAGVALTAFGAGSSLEGQLDATRGGLSLDLSGMNKIVKINADDMDCRVEAGVTPAELNERLDETDLFFPIDTGYRATLGGMAATRAGAASAGFYGTMRDVVLGLTVVTGEGKIIRTGGRVRKSAAGYDLTRLVIGSEGTLAIITELQLSLAPRPDAIGVAMSTFRSLEDAVNAAMVLRQMGVACARVDLMDALQMNGCANFLERPALAGNPALFLEFHGAEPVVKSHLAQAANIMRWHGASYLESAIEEEASERIWAPRRNWYPAARALAPGTEAFATDVAIPATAFAQTVAEAQDMAEAAGFLAPIVGHPLDGNFHMLINFDPDEPHQVDSACRIAENLARLAVSRGGSVSGEHGVGRRKRDALAVEAGEGIDMMRAIKTLFDPKGILNPGNLLPDPPNAA